MGSTGESGRGEVSITDALSQIEGSIKERTEGLANLKHVLRHNQGNPKLGRLNDKYFHKVFEALFRVASSERSTYLKSLNSTSKVVKSTSIARLSSCASTLRLAVDVGLAKIRRKTVTALLDHILDTLLDANGECCEPLALDYAKCLSTVLSHEPHVEHLDETQWTEATTFCLDRIKSANSQASARTLEGADGAVPSSSRLSVRSSHTLARSSQAVKTNSFLHKQVLEEFLSTLRHLTSASSAPFLSKSKAILSTILQSFHAPQSMAQSQVNSLVILNNTLQQTRTENISLTAAITRECLQVARNLWSSKLVSIKDEILVMLVTLHPYVKHNSRNTEDPLFAGELESLIETLRSEYARRDLKDQLQLDDLALQLELAPRADDLSFHTFALRDGLTAGSNTPTAEHNWTLLRLLALFSTLGNSPRRITSGDLEESNNDRTKRQRLTHWSDELLRMLYDPHFPTKVCALQLMCFTAQTLAIDDELLEHMVERLSTLVNDDNGSLASWALQGLTSCAIQTSAVSKKLAKYWPSIWNMTSRMVNSSQTCRASCHFLRVCMQIRLVSRQRSLETCTSMISSLEVNGPSVFCDASAQFLVVLIDHLQGESITSKDIAERVLTWLFRTWSPSNFHDKAYAAQHIHTGVKYQLDLIGKCLNGSCHIESFQTIPVWRSVAQSWKSHERVHEVLNYLLLEETIDPFTIRTASEVGTSSRHTSSAPHTASESLAISLCISELTRAMEHWEAPKDQRVGSITKDMVRMLSTLALVGLCLGTCYVSKDVYRASQLRSANERLMDVLFRDLSNQDCEQSKIDALLGILAHHMPPLLNGPSETNPGGEHNCLSDFCVRVTKLLDSRNDASQLDDFGRGGTNHDDLMDIDSEFDSQLAVRTDRTNSTSALPRSLVASTGNIETQRACVAMYATAMQYSASLKLDEMDEDSASAAIVDYIMSLPPLGVLASRPTLAALHEHSYHLAPKDVERMLGFIENTFLTTYEYERSETALALLLDVVIGYVEVWTDSSHREMYSFGLDLYGWLTTTALNGKLLPVTAQKRLAKLLLQLLEIDLNYAQSQGVPSVRTTLFRVLAEGSLEVKYFLAEQISAIFGLFTLSMHDEIFEDLNTSLPTDAEWREGMAIRTFVLANVASKWHSLLRGCIYRIFETAGLVSSSTSYATRCIRATAQSLGVGEAQELFKLFSRQLLFTWLESRPLDKIPFAIFGYENLAGLLQHNLDEVYAQLVIRDKADETQWLAKHLRTTTDQMLRASFSKAMAYAMSSDVCVAEGGEAHCETQLKDQLKSKNDYYTSVRRHFPEIMAQMIISAHQEYLLDKALEKRPKYQYMSSALKTMKTFGSSDRTLPATQQPHFAGRYLIDQLERLCRRAFRKEVETIASTLDTPSLTIILRLILDDVNPALGPLHACQVVRKLRLVVAVAGDVALEGYPLEMLIRALRPLAVDSQCADDATGLLRYLFYRGKSSLEGDMPMLTGNALLVLLSLKSFMISRQDRTTQESQFRKTVSNMHIFHDWLVDYLISCMENFKEENSVSKVAFQKIVYACRDLNLPGSAEIGNPASDMLQVLLDDERRKGSLVRVTERKQLISHLCRSFEEPPSKSRDVFGNDRISVTYAKCILESTRALSGAQRYEAWTARVLGRAYSSTVSSEFTEFSRRPLPEFLGQSAMPLRSQHAIAAKLQDLLMSEQMADVGESENTLRRVLTRYGDAKNKDHRQSEEFRSLLTPQVVAAMLKAAGDTPQFGLGRSTLIAKGLKEELYQASRVKQTVPLDEWTQRLTLAICRWTEDDPIVGSMVDLTTRIKQIATQLFPFLCHLALEFEAEKEQVICTILSDSFNDHFRDCQNDFNSRQKSRLMLETLLHLLTQQFSAENTRVDRLKWLEIDYLLASQAAARCMMPTTALYFAEIAAIPENNTRSKRSSSITPNTAVKPSDELLLSIYRTIDDPDSFYGVQQEASLQSVLDRVDHERDGLTGIMLHSARMDASLLRLGQAGQFDLSGIIKSIGAMNLSSLTHDLLSKRQGQQADIETTATMLDAARKLGQWNITPPQTFETDTSMLYSIFRGLSATSDLDRFKVDLDCALRFSVHKLQDPQLDARSIRSTLSALAVLTEVDEMSTVRSSADLDALWATMQTRQKGWDIGRFSAAQQIVSYRESLFGILSRSPRLREALHVSLRDSRLVEVKAVLSSSEFARKNDEIQQSLTAATYLSELVPTCKDLGLRIDAAAQLEAASILWRQGEVSSSVQMLQKLRGRSDLEKQAVKIGNAGLLAQLGHEVASARLEKPEDVISRYLKPAIEQLEKAPNPSEAGRVYFEFASFCDQQLQSPGNIEDFQRLAKISERRKSELLQYETILKSIPSSDKNRQKDTKQAALRAQQWYKLDNEEYQRARQSRENFVQQALRCYLEALQHCEDFDASVVRFFALWLEYSDSDTANTGLEKALGSAPAWKFVGLMNQLTSRLLKDGSVFQRILTNLVARLCTEHPYHTIHHIFASCNSTISASDPNATLRQEAAVRIKTFLYSGKRVGELCKGLWEATMVYHNLAGTKIEAVSGRKYTLNSVRPAAQVDATVRKLKVPPATLHLALRPDLNYQKVPIVVRFRSEIKIANGLSAPKVLIAVGSDGKEYRQLFKGGNDDLRQDAIMEQVFDEVSKMLQKHKTTRQRNLHIRTYKVIPLSSVSGIIEFVPNSLPLADFLIPAHGKYHPGDLKNNKCREIISNASRLAKEQRYKEYKSVTEKFQPVLRHFFFERFEDPDEWFERRLAYTRSTAAISMLGYVLGLGDRHTHNILLDEKSGEVIHIDLGVAFEAGRVLPIPEVVPFRMTRDIVDGMGVTKTEGVFRRCCEFTMDALREEKDGIMTLLNVLRYDPLYSWTLSPIRAKRMQAVPGETEGEIKVAKSNPSDNEAGEAERALSVVEKKLSKTLSTSATVNELIQQATDERNLAVLFAGWSAYA